MRSATLLGTIPNVPGTSPAAAAQVKSFVKALTDAGLPVLCNKVRASGRPCYGAALPPLSSRLWRPPADLRLGWPG